MEAFSTIDNRPCPDKDRNYKNSCSEWFHACRDGRTTVYNKVPLVEGKYFGGAIDGGDYTHNNSIPRFKIIGEYDRWYHIVFENPMDKIGNWYWEDEIGGPIKEGWIAHNCITNIQDFVCEPKQCPTVD